MRGRGELVKLRGRRGVGRVRGEGELRNSQVKLKWWVVVVVV